jgi:hypothetical protein
MKQLLLTSGFLGCRIRIRLQVLDGRQGLEEVRGGDGLNLDGLALETD